MKFDNEINVNYIARPIIKPLASTRFTLLRGSNESIVSRDFESALRTMGMELDICTLDMIPPARQTIISIIDLDLQSSFFSQVDSMGFVAFQDFLKRINKSGILWVTGAAQVKCKDPRYAMVLGMARTIRIEANIDMATLELEHFNQQGWSATQKVLEDFDRRLHEPDVDPVLEYVHSDGYIQTGKFHWIKIVDELKHPVHVSKPKRLDIRQRGALQTLHWKQFTPSELLDDQIEVEVKAVGMNFKVRDECRRRTAKH